MRHPILLSLAFLLACIGGACVTPTAPRPLTPGDARGPAFDFAPQVADEATWKALASRPGTEHMARTEVVKVILDRSDDRIYFLESNRWPIHFFFAQRFLDKQIAHAPEEPDGRVVRPHRSHQRRDEAHGDLLGESEHQERDGARSHGAVIGPRARRARVRTSAHGTWTGLPSPSRQSRSSGHVIV